jgi:hypothetical protein
MARAVEVYEKLYYTTKIKPEISSRLRDKPGLNKGERLAFQRKVAIELYENETEEVKAEVTAAIDEVKLAIESRAVAEEEAFSVGPAAGGRTPLEYQRYAVVLLSNNALGF